MPEGRAICAMPIKSRRSYHAGSQTASLQRSNQEPTDQSILIGRGDNRMASLSNKTALVTGASRGIGRATAQTLASAGAHVIIHYGRAAAEADALAADIRAAGGCADTARADLSIPEGAPKLAKQVRAIAGERLDVFVSNAGISKAGTIEDHTVEDFDNLFATNVRSSFFLLK